VLVATFAMVGAFDVLAVVLAIGTLEIGGSGAGYLTATHGAGAVVGALASLSLVGRKRLVPVLLALHLLRRDDPDEPHTMGFDLRRPWQDLWRGAALAAAVGIPGLGLYLAARELGLNTTVSAANLAGAWWTVPVLVLAAAQNAVLEEVVMVGYLFRRWGEAGWGPWRIILTSALVREDGGHGAVLAPGALEGLGLGGVLAGHPAVAGPAPAIVVTGPRRDLLRGSGLPLEFAAPHGDMMLTGCHGLLRAFRERAPLDTPDSGPATQRGPATHGEAAADAPRA